MPSRTLDFHVTVADLPEFKELYSAVHAMLWTRLKHGQDGMEFLDAINRVITAHDEIAATIQERIDEAEWPT